MTDAAPLARLRRQLGLRVLLLTDTGADRSAAAAALEAGLADAMLDDAVALVTLERAVDVQNILRKLGARSRVEAVSIYLGKTTLRVG
ncbi:MAG: hypothetical protein ABWZ91_04575 [Nocardioides sp.]